MIAIDATPAITGRTGIARYVNELAAAFDRQAVPATTFSVGRAVVDAPAADHHLPVPLRIVDAAWRWTHHPRLERLVGTVRSVHASGPVLPAARAPIVAVVHDVAALERPDLHPSRDVVQLRRYVAGLHRAAAVITVSATTGDRLVATGAVTSARVHVVPNGRSQLGSATPPPLPRSSYVLAVGAPVPRKGFDSLVRAVARLEGIELVVVGPPADGDPALARLAAASGISPRFHRVTAADDSALAGWYEHAAAVAVPSIDEGFGLPIVEAQAAGVPVVASDIEVFREVSGMHATLVPVGDDATLADALAEALVGGSSVDERIAGGRANAARYTWDACADGTLAVHRLVSSAGS